MQTNYSSQMDVGRPGMKADDGPSDVLSRVNPAVAIPFGCAVCPGTDAERDVKLPTTAAEAAACQGVAMATQSLESSASGVPQYPVNSSIPMETVGRLVVQVTEDVAANDDVYVRFADGVADTDVVQKGSFGKSPDGAAKVVTLTPTGANTTKFGVSIFSDEGKLLATAQVTSDSDGTATEICDALRTALGTVPGITLGGTSTLTLTSAVAGKNFSVTVSGPGVIAIVETTANSQTAARRSGWKYKTAAEAGGYATVELTK